MKYLDAVETIKILENKYEVLSIKYKDLALWPFIRIYLFDSLEDNSSQQTISRKTVFTVLRAIFWYNPLRFFKQNKVWLFNAVERRKYINGKAIHRVSGAVTQIVSDTLMIEKPDSAIIHSSKNKINEKNIVSEAILIFLSHVIAFFLRFFRVKLEGEKLLKTMINDYNIHYNYAFHVRHFIAQYYAMNIILSIASKPALVIIECPYTMMGYVWSIKKHNIPVIELQHGVLNKNHYAYNSMYPSSELYPDALCVFGKIEYEYFTNQNTNYSPLIYETGLFVLDESIKYFKNDIFSDLRKNYKKIIAVSGQPEHEDEQLIFYNNLAKKHNQFVFLYIPRKNAPSKFNLCENFRVCLQVNIYEYLKWCDIHMTISSTTCLEAQYFNKPTIFFDYQNLASRYYSKIVKETNGGFYINTENEFDDAITKINDNNFQYLELFTPDHYNNIKTIIEKHILT
jgi:hypothetical protein